jgi:hypothetical protein
VLKNAGASLLRDAVDSRIVNEIETGTAQFGSTWDGGGKGIIDSQTDVGGWPELKTTTALLDTDEDGMPDDWETQNRLNPQDLRDGPLDRDADGYTNIEEYLKTLVPPTMIPLP